MKPRNSLPWSQQPATGVCPKTDDSSQFSHDLFAEHVPPPLSSTLSSPNFSVVFIFHVSRQWRWTVPSNVAAFSLVNIDRRFEGTHFSYSLQYILLHRWQIPSSLQFIKCLKAKIWKYCFVAYPFLDSSMLNIPPS